MRRPSEFNDLKSLQSTWTDGLLILMYHAIETPSLFHKLQYLYVDPRKLRAQIEELNAFGAQFVPASELGAAGTGRQVLMTFDDAFQNVITNALPILQEFGVPAITYVVAGQIGGSNAWDNNKRLQKRPLMTGEDLQEWIKFGNEVGAHTVNHPNLLSLSPEDARREIFDSKKIIEDAVGRPVVHFCYPFGCWNPRLRDLVKEAGYETAMTCNIGYNTPATDRLELRRLTARHKFPYLAAARGLLP